ncbi:MAG: 2-oxoglutarate dehydrogenase complex dihydrolipoyllysine-residue succinyltransferase [Desulfuromonadales bacterium]|jgi:2-oxoglutarate dehydrogenase E2 component (dihydrolipoamide succinyltransferase)
MEIKIPEIGESILEALVANWMKDDGAAVAKDEIICELETDKVNVELNAEVSGILHIVVPVGETVPIGTVIATIEEQDVAETTAAEQPAAGVEKGPAAEAAQEPAKAKQEQTTSAPVNPAARLKAAEHGIDLDQVDGSGRHGRITLDDVLAHAKTTESRREPEQEQTAEKEQKTAPVEVEAEGADDGRPVTREVMTPIRQRIAARLLQARQQTAMLTTFNEADMSWVKRLRGRHQEHFTKKHGIKLGMMSFFVKASIEALKEYPAVNARIDGSDIVYHHYYDVGIAVGTERGLVVPVLRNADQLTFAEIEQQIADLAAKAKARKLTLADLEGGTFTITNGGIYGSLLSTPIINPPQCGVLGMHSIQDRPVVVDNEIVIRPIMNLALSYDHRLIDGREAVGFLKLVKDYIEDPSELFLEL